MKLFTRDGLWGSEPGLSCAWGCGGKVGEGVVVETV